MNKKGYTLVELIITLAVIGIMVVPIFNAFIEANRVNLQSRRQISAAYLAQNELEAIKGMSRSHFNKYDKDTTDGVDIDNSSWTFDDTDTITNGNTDFSVRTQISNITDDLGITINSTPIVNLENRRNYEVLLGLEGSNGNVKLKTKESSVTFENTDKNLYLLFESINDDLSQLTMVDSDMIPESGKPKLNISTSLPDFNNMIVMNIEGYNDMSDEWSINIINRSSWTVDAKPYNDPDNHIKMVSDNRSLKSVYIGNALPVATGSPSTVKEYYRVIITVSYKGTVFEVIESTVGK